VAAILCVVAVLMENPGIRLPRYWSLDILRGVCALTVFLNHVILYSNFAPSGAGETWLHRWLGQAYEIFTALTWPTGGQHPAVIGFFVLSGFCIHRPFERRIGQPGLTVAWGDYFVRRTRRIMPVYWVGALLGLLVVAAVHWRPTGDVLLALHTTATPAQMAARLGGYSGLWLEEVYVGNCTLGSVAVEILIYVGYPLFFLGAAAGRWWLLTAVAIGLQLLALTLRPYVDPIVLFGSVLVMVFFWYLGALAAYGREKHGWRVRAWWLGGVWALFLGLKLIPYFYGLNMLKQALWGVLCMWLIGWLLDWEKRNEGLRTRAWSRLLRWSGNISYPLFAVHTPVILLVNWSMLTLAGSHSYAWQLAINFALSLAIAVAVHHGIEKRFYHAQTAG
jgi:peptidoglycan/LPS O-acetylase OafA/YrhL